MDNTPCGHVDADGNALKRVVKWNKYCKRRHGVKRLIFDSVVIDIIGDSNKIEVKSYKPYTLIVNGRKYKVKKGESSFAVN